MAERTEGSTEIAATPAEIMRVITDFDAYPEWAGVKSAEVTDTDAQGRPSQVAMHVAQMGVEARYTLQYAYAPEDGGVSWTTVEASGALKDLQGEYLIQPGDGGSSKVTYRLAMETTISLPGFLRRQAEKTIISTALGGLKKQVERPG